MTPKFVPTVAHLFTVWVNSIQEANQEHYRRVEGECFGLPNGGMIAGIVIGLIVIVVGLGLFLQQAGTLATFGISSGLSY